jgi:hypothetical protein
MFGPDWPPVTSANRPGTSFDRSAVLLGAASFIASSEAVVMAKAASCLRSPLALATPVTTIS